MIRILEKLSTIEETVSDTEVLSNVIRQGEDYMYDISLFRKGTLSPRNWEDEVDGSDMSWAVLIAVYSTDFDAIRNFRMSDAPGNPEDIRKGVDVSSNKIGTLPREYNEGLMVIEYGGWDWDMDDVMTTREAERILGRVMDRTNALVGSVAVMNPWHMDYGGADVVSVIK